MRIAKELVAGRPPHAVLKAQNSKKRTIENVLPLKQKARRMAGYENFGPWASD